MALLHKNLCHWISWTTTPNCVSAVICLELCTDLFPYATNKLYSGLVSTMTSHLKDIAKSIEAAQGPLFLEELNRKWTDHNKALQMI
ncbi:hypothetical protein LguiB_010223 [Lonicera macranthoides]